MIKAFLRYAAVFLCGVVGVPCLLLGLLGVRGRLADVSELENLQFGLQFLAMAAGAIGLGLVALLFSFRFGNRPHDDRSFQE